MRPLQAAAKEPCPNGAINQYRSFIGTVSHPPLSTGTNHNLIDKVTHKPGDRVIWHIIHSPDGSFTYDYSIKLTRRRRKR